MSQLDTGNAPLPLDKGEHAPQGFDVGVAPDAEVLRADTAIRSYCGSFGEDGRGASYRPAPEVHQMPIRGQPVQAGVLAHRGDEDSVRQFQPAQPQRIK
jgi:hypothetical protein